MRARLLAIGLACVCCGPRLGSARAAFDHGDMPEARRQLVLLEQEYCAYDPRARAEYALYRGLTELALGHARFAAAWLGRAKLALDREPWLFDVDARARLLAAWRSLGFMPGEPGLAGAPSGPCAAAGANPAR